MSAFNPFAVEEVPLANAAVSEFANQARYSGGLSGVGSGKGTIYVPGPGGEWVAAGEAPGAEDVYTGENLMDTMEGWGKKVAEKNWSPGLGPRGHRPRRARHRRVLPLEGDQEAVDDRGPGTGNAASPQGPVPGHQGTGAVVPGG